MKNELIEILSESNIIADEGLDNYKIDGKKPEFVVFPENIDQISKVINLASKENLKIIPMGSGTKINIGNIPSGVDIVLSLTKINKILEINSGDLTTYVEAGVKLSDLNQALSEHGLFLPVDPPFSDSCTIGGIVTADSNGPLRQKYGKIKEMITCMKILLADGSVIKTGANVVKNASGYNISRLYVGSMGTIGIITEIGLKLQPLPETEKNVLLSFENIYNIVNFCESVRDSFLLPSFIEYISPAFLKFFPEAPVEKNDENYHHCLIGFGGFSETVDWQIEQVKIMSKDCKSFVSDGTGDYLIKYIRNLHSGFNDSIIFKLSIIVPEFGKVLKDIKELSSENNLIFISHFGSGIIYVIVKPDEKFNNHSNIFNLINGIERIAVDSGGSCMIENIPLKFKENISVWGNKISNLGIMKKIKEQFDPKNIFNPHRFAGGI